MRYGIRFYELVDGDKPVEIFLEDLKVKNVSLWTKTLAALLKLKEREYHRMPLTEKIEPGLFSLRVKSQNNILRILFTFRKEKIIILLHGFIKKSMKIPAKTFKDSEKTVERNYINYE